MTKVNKQVHSFSPIYYKHTVQVEVSY